MKNAITIIAVLFAGIVIGVFATRGSSGPENRAASDTGETGRTPTPRRQQLTCRFLLR